MYNINKFRPNSNVCRAIFRTRSQLNAMFPNKRSCYWYFRDNLFLA